MERQEVIRIIEVARNSGQRPDLSGVDLAYGIDLSGVDLREVDFSGANLCGADLRNADLKGARLIGADLRGAKLTGANLRKAKLSQANLDGLDLRGVEVTNKQVMAAESLIGTILPDGTPAITPLDFFEFD